ncbi:protein kinase C inhibitor [Nitzschia inconspicua]|uniref:Protein kinase C inhibitor n=1 Tax=Nitzschia inconspicua TaxID=303405 RepID=A0A9K3KVT6_9STRA|nr:protein kinase C inhibitor [Nitzschia inconspicua]
MACGHAYTHQPHSIFPRHSRVTPLPMALRIVTALTAVAISTNLAFGLSTQVGSALSTSKHVLFDTPVSNNGGKARIILYKKGIPEEECCVMSPAELGGFKSEDYLAISPQGKVPALKCQETGLCLAESDTVCRYLLSKYSYLGPSFQPDNARSNEIARFHDMYLTTIQSCLYRAVPPFGGFGDRMEALQEYSRQLYVISKLMDEDGPYLCGKDVSLADAAVFPSIVFASFMYPKFEHGIVGKPIPKNIEEWYQRMIDTDSAFQRVHEEIKGALQKWEANGRWDTIWLAGLRDTEPSTIFDKIVAGEIPATVVKEDDKILAFKDINPVAPAHVLVIPKLRRGLTRLSEASPEHYEILGRLMVAAGEIAKDESLGFGNGARIVVNDGPEAGQEVFHLHVHVLGGRAFSWPPG